MLPAAPTHPRRYDARQIGNYFIRQAHSRRQQVSIMHVLKLVYMAHGWTLALLDRPLINDQVEAWEYGPVIPSLYWAHRPDGIYNVQPLEIYEEPLESEVEAILYRVDEMYEGLSAAQLSRLTHIPGGPWAKIYRPGAKFRVIPDSLIAEHYKDKQRRAIEARD